ncbi:MAG: hypothetical protein OSA84_10865 [Akkermansiaceae bacterium]|nr:hypothetical protein [Akkermansiaceae bacterium]
MYFTIVCTHPASRLLDSRWRQPTPRFVTNLSQFPLCRRRRRQAKSAPGMTILPFPDPHHQPTMKITAFIAIGTVLAAASCFAQDKLVFKGSDTLGAKMVPQLTEAYSPRGFHSRLRRCASATFSAVIFFSRRSRLFFPFLLPDAAPRLYHM